MIRSGILRRLVLLVAVLLVSGAAAAMKLTSWTPANMCFCLAPEHTDTAAKSEAGFEAVAPSGGLKVQLDTNATAHSSSGAFAAAPMVELAEKSSHVKAHEGGGQSWAPWGKHSNHRYAASSDSGPSASLSGLWKLMSLTGRANRGEQAKAAHVAAAVSARNAGPKPSRPPKGSKPPSGAISSTPGSSATATPPGSAFGEDKTPVGELAGGGSTSAGSTGPLGSGSSGHGASSSPSNIAATPEPASFALIATGLLGIAGLVRRRRI